jgi:hypothetical protein
MRRLENTFEGKKLIASKNLLALKSANSQYVSVPLSTKFDFGTGDFAISYLVRDTSGSAIPLQIFKGASLLFFSAVNSIAGYGLSLTSDQGNGFTGVSQALPSTNNKLSRITFVREGTNLRGYINEKLIAQATIPALNTFNCFTGNSAPYLIATFGTRINLTANYVNGEIGNLVVMKGFALNEKDLSYLHLNNILPISSHPYVVAHYPLNQNFAQKAWDVVEQYNYAKVVPLTASHGDLMNFTNDEAGVTNPLIQTAWQNLYAKQKRGLNFLKATNLLQVQKVGAPLAVTTWSLYIHLMHEATEPVQKIIFSTLNGINEFGVYKIPNQHACQIIANSVLYGLTFGNFIPLDPNKGTGILFTSNGVTTRVFLKRGEDDVYLFETHPNTLPVFELNWFGNQTAGFQLYKSHIGRSSFFTKELSAREINLIMNSPRSDEYLSIDQAHLNLDFGDVFFSAGDYFVRDRSANNNHAKIFNFAPVVDLPFRAEQDTRISERRKALRFVSASNHFLTIANFNPTKEKGYTIIVSSCLDVNRNYSTDILFSKGSNVTLEYKVLYGVNASKFIEYNITDNIGVIQGRLIDHTNYNNSKITHQVMVEQIDNLMVTYLNGFARSPGSTNSLRGFNEIGNLDLHIGKDLPRLGSSNANLNGFIAHVSIYKGVLSQEQILNIVNNSLGANINLRDLDCQLYLNFEEIINDAGTYKIKDWSPQNRTVILNNYSLAEITEGDPNYRLVDLDTLK